MATSTEMPLQSTRTREAPSAAILSKADGIFIGMVLLVVGAVWFLNSAEILNLGPKFGELVLPILVLFAGLYLVIVKVVRG